MSRSNYHDDLDEWALIMWRGAVKSALRGRRGQAFLREMVAALDTMPEKRLIARELVKKDPGAAPQVCAMGAVCAARGLDVSGVDPECPETVAATVGLAEAMVREIAYQNDEGSCLGWRVEETPEQRWARMREWAVSHLRMPT